MKSLPAGTRIVCPGCAAEIATLKVDILSGAILKTEQFDFVQPGHGPGTPMQCTRCRTSIYGLVDGRFRIHSSEGWK